MLYIYNISIQSNSILDNVNMEVYYTLYTVKCTSYTYT